ncbi:MAG: OmpA-like protein [Pseudomonadota bacterium]|jgi:outer membrane protein OmpA-like peptidoglycan-associated protein
MIRRSSFGPAALGVALAVLLSGCISGKKVEEETTRMSEIVRSAKVQAYYCAPEALALAESHIEFARLESDRGDTISAWEHIKIARENTAKVFAVKDKKGCCPDRDGDSFCDAVDKCPDEPEDFDSDEDDDGCPEYDRDGDGLHDNKDRCPEAAEDKDGFLDEDGCPEPDNDRDGVPDERDGCPNVPEDKDGFADGDGCPDFDNDGDGILDYPVVADKCPNKPEVYNGLDDTDGCPDVKKEEPPPKPKEYKNIVVEKDRIVFKKQINFKTNSAKIIGAVSFQILDECADALKSRQDVRVQVEGHTDERGPDKKNKKLSQQRAESVVKALIDRGIAASRLLPIGFGEERPLDPAHNKAAWAKNRRVEFNFLMD